MTSIKEMLSTNFNHTKSQNHADNCDNSNHKISDRVSGKEQRWDNLESSE